MVDASVRPLMAAAAMNARMCDAMRMVYSLEWYLRRVIPWPTRPPTPAVRPK
jgi:hypothetical protein